jgi:hypothetical protein
MTHPKKPDQTWLEWDAEHGDGGSEGTWSKPFEQPEGSGKYYIYNSTSGETKPYTEGPYAEQTSTGQSHLAPLLDDLVNLGLVSPNVGRDYGAVEQFNNEAAASPYRKDPYTGLWVERASGKVAPEWVQKAQGDATDPYAGNREARAAAGEARAARAAAINEAMNAIDLQTMRQKAALAGAQFAAPTDTGGYFPQLGPGSPLVRSGLADPMKFTPVPYNAGIGEDQTAKDLAMIRRIAGVG